MESDTLTFIGKNYELIKKSLKKELRKNRNLEFDEDVFHDTLLKCIEKYDEPKFQNDEEFIAYIIVSFNGLNNQDTTKDSSYQGLTDTVTVGITIAARTRVELADLAIDARQCPA